MGMVETLEHPHLAPHALLIPLDFLLQNGPQCGLARDVHRHRLCGGTPRGREGERGSGERVGGGGEERGGVDGPATRRSVRVHCTGSTCHIARCHMRRPWCGVCDIFTVSC